MMNIVIFRNYVADIWVLAGISRGLYIIAIFISILLISLLGK